MDIKKRLSSFLKRENGRISKKSILTVGAVVGTAALASIIATKTARAGLSAWLSPSEGRPVTIHGTYG